MTPDDLDRLEALAAAAEEAVAGLGWVEPQDLYPEWEVQAAELAAALDPATVQQLIAAARRGVVGYWSAKSNHDITAQQWGAIREGLKTATDRGLTVVVLDGIELTWHMA